MKAGKKTQRYALQQRVTQKLAQRNLVIISFTGIALFAFTYLYFNIGSPGTTKAAVIYPHLTFSNQTLISGTDGSEGAVYKFSNVSEGIDAQIHLLGISGDAMLTDIDYYSSGCGPAWQPVIQTSGNSTSYIDWEIKFKKAGTNTDTVIPSMAITAADFNSSPTTISEFVSALNPVDYNRDASSPLKISYADNMLSATMSETSKSNGEMKAGQPMIQMNYSKVSSFIYRTGAVNSGPGNESKVFSLYFKSYYSGTPYSMPAELIGFSGEKNIDNTITLKWETAAENDKAVFMIEKSADGKNNKEIIKLDGKGSNSGTNTYTYIDTKQALEKNYYTILQSDKNGDYVRLKTICIAGDRVSSPVTIRSAIMSPSRDHLQINYGTESNALLRISLTDVDKKEIYSELIQAKKGMNEFDMHNVAGLKKGIYFVSIDNYKLNYKAVKAIRY